MTVYLLWTWYSYEDRVLFGVYATRELAESELPAARWVKDDDRGGWEALHPVYGIPWVSPHFDHPEIEERSVAEKVTSQPEVPEGPQFGPPLPPRCPVVNASPRMRCVLFVGHDGDHKMERYYPMTTTDYLLFSASVAPQ